MRQGLDKYSYRNGTVIKHKKDDFRVPELRFPNFRIRDFEPQEYSELRSPYEEDMKMYMLYKMDVITMNTNMQYNPSKMLIYFHIFV